MRGTTAVAVLVIMGALLAAAPPSLAATPAFLVPVLPPTSASETLVSPDPSPTDAPFGPNVRASEDDTSGSQNEITMAVASDGRIHMGWNDLRAPNPDYRCGYAYSTDGGATWSANRLFHAPGWAADGDPVIVVDVNDNVYFICMPFSRSGGGSRVQVYKSTDGGVSFGSAVNVSDTTSGFNDKPWAHAVGMTLHACYTNFAASAELRYTRSLDGGATWDGTRILDTGGNANGCVLADGPGSLYLAWVRNGSIYALRSGDGGTTWSPPRLVGPAPFTVDPNQRAGALPMIAADPTTGAAYVVWTANDGGGAWDIRLSRTTDAGSTWNAFTIVNDVATGRQFMPGIDVDTAGTVHVSWYDDRSGLMAYRYSRSMDGGATWAPSLRVTDLEWASTFFIGDYTALVVDAQGWVNAGWADHRSGETEAYFARAGIAGPPRLARIDVSPPEVWITADDGVQFTAASFDQWGNPYPASFTWAATGGTVISGFYFAQLAGDWQIWANASGVSGSALVHVAPGALARIDVTPPSVTITADDSAQFAAAGFDAKGNAVSITPSWTVSDGSIVAGLFTPSRVGTWTVTASAAGRSGSAAVTVLPGRIVAIDVTPPVAVITADEVVTFTAGGRDAKGNAVPVAPSWWADGGPIDLGGRYSGQLVGVWTVFANASGLSGSARVTVTPGALARIEVAPTGVTITADDTMAFTARGFDADGNELAIAPGWSATRGSITLAGLYTPGAVGLVRVQASLGAVAGEALVTVVPGRLARIDVTPPSPTITADETLLFAALGFDGKGNVVMAAFTWETTCGTVVPTGLYTPRPAGLCLVFANASAVSGSATVTVLPGALAWLEVTPPIVAITADETAAFAARGFDAKGNAVAIAPAWRTAEGSIDAAGVYTPRRTGTWGVWADVGAVSGGAQAVVSPGALAEILVAPGTANVRADKTFSFSARGHDGVGNDVTITPVWTVTNGTIAGGLYDPWLVGTWTVTATASGIEGTATVIVTPGAPTSVLILPTDAIAHEGERITFIAVAYDAKGNTIHGAAIGWRVEGGIGSVTVEGEFAAGGGGVGRVVATATWEGARASGSAPVEVRSAPAYACFALVAAIALGALLTIRWLVIRRRTDRWAEER